MKLRHIIMTLLVWEILAGFSQITLAKNDDSDLKANDCFVDGVERVLERDEAQEIKTFNDLLWAFTRGVEPDLNDPTQRSAFEIYRKMRFGDPNTNLERDPKLSADPEYKSAVDEIARRLKQNPELSKEPFRNYQIEAQERIYPVPPKLAKFLNSQVRSAGQTRGNLFQIEANSGYWKKVLGYKTPTEFKVKIADKAETKKLKKEAKAHFSQFLDAHLSPELREQLANSKTSPRKKAKLLYQTLSQLRVAMIRDGQNSGRVAQAMIDIVHTIAYFDPSVQGAFKSTDGLERLGAYRRVLEERDSLAMELGFENHFEQMLKDLDVKRPTGVASEATLAKQIREFEAQVIEESKVVKGQEIIRTVRHLSLTESPFRSCIGGSDCSSQTYLTRALDPNYHYFTLTNESGFSNGHITVVMGEAQLNGEKVKVAFIDKVQNVDNVDLPIMLEGLRRSVDEKGYILALPEDVGDHNGISNEAATRSFIAHYIQTDQENLLTSFKPHSHSYSFPNQYSRAEEGLPMRAVRPYEILPGVQLSAGSLVQPWRTRKFNLERLVQASIDLKNADVDARLRYIPLMKAIEEAGLKPDPLFGETMQGWLKDPNQPLKLRKQVLLNLWVEGKTTNKHLANLLESFSDSEKVTLLQNFLDTPRFRKLIFQDKKSIPHLVAISRSNKNVTSQLLDHYAGGNQAYIDAMALVIKSSDISDQQVIETLPQIKKSFGTSDISDATEILTQLEETKVSLEIENLLYETYTRGIYSDVALGRALSASLEVSKPTLRRFGERILSSTDRPEWKSYPIVKTYQEIANLKQTKSLSNMNEAAVLWMRDSQIDPAEKADLLMTQVGQGAKRFDQLLEAVPKGQRKKLWERIEKRSSLKFYLDRAKGMGLRDTLLDHAVIESFMFSESRFSPSEENPKEFQMMGKRNKSFQVKLTKPFEIALTPVTQLQWIIVMGNNPSRFVKGGLEITVSRKKIKLRPNAPVEQVSHNDIQEFLRRTGTGLPTEAEWEYAARGGSDKELFADDENSGGQTRDVSHLKPNAFGLYDLRSNVWEWVADWYGDYPTDTVTNPTGAPVGSYRLIRGSSWKHDAHSINRLNVRPRYRSDDLGFRPVRKPR